LPIEYCSAPEDVARYEVDKTPAVITVQNVVKCTGRVPDVDIIKEWLKDLRL
jgi:hypothetical protein